MSDIILLTDEQAEYIKNEVITRYDTYSKNDNVISIYLSSFRDPKEDNRPVIELTLVANWFKSPFKQWKVKMGDFGCPNSDGFAEEPIFRLSMADVQRFDSIKEGSITDEEYDIISDVERCHSILMDKNETCIRLLRMKKDKVKSIGAERTICVPPIDL